MKNADTFVPYLVLLAALISLALSAGDRPQLPGPQEPLPRTPPTPPLLETFQGDPQLSLFPRLGDFRPEDDDERLPFWKSYREHLLKISGVVKADAVSSNRIFSFRGIKGIDSVAHFAPLAVQPNTRYRVRLSSTPNCRKRPAPVSACCNSGSFSGWANSTRRVCTLNSI